MLAQVLCALSHPSTRRTWLSLFDSTYSTLYFSAFLLSVFFFPFFHLSDEQQPELNKKIMENLCDSANNGSEGTYDVLYLATQGFTLSKNNNKSGISGLRLVHTLDTARKAYYSQLWKLVTHSWQRDCATGYCHRRRREQAIAQHGVLRERYRAAKKNLTAVLYDLTNAFACGAQESQAGDPASLADVVRAEVQNLTAREHLCQRLAGAQLRLDCADGQLAAKIGSGTLPGDTVAGGWFLLHFHPKLDAFLQATPELQINATLPFDIPNAPESLDVGTSTYADDIIRGIPGISAENVITGINRSNDALNTALAPDYVQNSGKQEILPHFAGRGSHAEFRIIFGDFHNLEGRVHRRVRYLGPHIAFDGRLGGAKHHEDCRLLETRTRSSSGASRRPHRGDGAVLFVQWLAWPLSGYGCLCPVID